MKTLLLAAATLVSAASFAQTTASSLKQPKKTQLVIGKTVAPASLLKAASKTPEMITKQPEGKLYKDMYGYSEGFVSQWGAIYEDVRDGVARDFVVGNDGSYFMKSPISAQPTDSWIKSEKAEGDTIVFNCRNKSIRSTMATAIPLSIMQADLYISRLTARTNMCSTRSRRILSLYGVTTHSSSATRMPCLV